MLFGDAKSKIRQWNTYYHALPAEIMGESVTIQPKKQKWSEAKRQKKKKKEHKCIHMVRQTQGGKI